MCYTLSAVFLVLNKKEFSYLNPNIGVAVTDGLI